MEGNNVLHLASLAHIKKCASYASTGLFRTHESARDLLRHQNKAGKTPLSLACENGFRKVALMFLAYGAETCPEDYDALYDNAECENTSGEHEKILKHFLRYDTTAKDQIQKAKKNQQALKKMLEKSVPPSWEDASPLGIISKLTQ